MAMTVSTYYEAVATELFGTTSPVTGSAPSAATDGISLKGIESVTVIASVANGVTNSGAGSFLCYTYNPLIGRWSRAPAGDLTISTSGARDTEVGTVLVSKAFVTAQGVATRAKWIPSGFTFSAGSAGCTVTLIGA